MTSPYAFTEEELKMMDKNYKKPKVYILHQGCCHNVGVIVFRPKSGLCQRKRWLLLKTLFMSGAQLPLKTNKGCQKRLLIFCKGIKDSKTKHIYFSKIWERWWRVWRRGENLGQAWETRTLVSFHSQHQVSLTEYLSIEIATLHAFRKMFLLQYALEVKLGEKTRLETIIKVGGKA